MTLEKYIQFIKAHERLIVIVLAAFLLYRTGQGIENAYLHRDTQKAQQAAQVVTVDTTANKQLTDQLQQMRQDSQTRTDQLNQDIAAKLYALQKQQQQDMQATQQQILDRWKLLLPMKPGAVQSNNGTDQITPEAATATVTALEQIPVLKTEVADLNAKILVDDGIIGAQDSLIVGLNKQIVDEKASHQADVNLEKAKSKHSWFKGFKWGVVVGAVGTEAVRLWAGKP